MRTADQTPPTVTVDPHPPPAWMSGRLVVALERLPQSAYVWDDANTDVTWDDATPQRVWDAPFIGAGFTDVWCDLTNLVIVHGEPDARDQYAMSACQLELRDPGDGRYRTRTVDGRLVYYAPGRRLAIWWQDPAGVKWWLFSGQLATWRERFDNTVAIEAYAGGSLGRPPGLSWSTGTNTQTLRPRVTAVLSAANYLGAARSDLGDVTLAVPEAADTAALDVIRQAAWSDGGIVYTDADDTLVVRDRRWRDGRPDQTVIPTLTDNVCDLPGSIVVWSPEAADDDLLIAGRVRLENTADPTPLVAVISNAAIDPAIVFTHPGSDLWQTQTDGDALAAHIAGERTGPRLALGAADIHLHDRRFNYWARACDLRLGDIVRFEHRDTYTTGEAFYDVTAVVTTVRHLITPDWWTVQLATSPAVDYTAVEMWDVTALSWDDPNPLAVWR